MKTFVLCGITLLASTAALAQTDSTAGADPSSKTVTLTGCVGGGTDGMPITLSQALIIPASSQPAESDRRSSPSPSGVSAPATEPLDATLPPPGAAATPAPSTIGTSGTKSPRSDEATTGIVTGTAPAGSSQSSVTGYRLSGADMQPWVGKRVQVIGMFAPAPATSTAVAPVASAGTPTPPPVLEFKVQTVQPATGSCPK
ncbi:MAG: hypothetical protein JWL71_251 [Acidobacteria bacterium]|nr:hypothetical protein [Acidobacteriota bacterium]